MPVLKFFDVKRKKGFSTDKFKFVGKKVNGKIRHFAVAKAPSGIEAWRVVSNDFYMKYKQMIIMAKKRKVGRPKKRKRRR